MLWWSGVTTGFWRLLGVVVVVVAVEVEVEVVEI